MLVPRAVRELGAFRVPTVVITHPNLDHFNGVLDIVEPLSVRTVLVGRAFADHASEHPRSPEAHMIAELARRGVALRVISQGERLSLGAACLEFLSPPPDADWPMDNDMSLVAGLWLPPSKRPSLLLCGDIQDRALAHLSSLRPPLHPAILEAPHHGSAREAAFSFVAAANPLVVLQSTGPSRAMDARWADTRAGRTWLCTAIDGACFAQVQADGSVRAGRTPR
jgi:competence protein ComEC